MAERAAIEPPVQGAWNGAYEVICQLAVGGMAEIHLARALSIEGFEKQVVIKRMRPELARSRSYQIMFSDEARVAASLCHGNIVTAYDFGFDGETYYLIMEYVPGVDARRLLSRCLQAGFHLPLEYALKIVIDAAAGLHAAHETLGPDGCPAQIIHRDLSPSNILVAFGGWVKLTDFGVAKAARRRTATRTGQLKGKASYMSLA
jgi:eukaryotic-like serine/threonine-protein kinase